MKHILKITLLSSIITGIVMSSALASKEARVQHYVFEAPTSKAEALKLYHENMGIIGYILQTISVSPAQMETIHERSYALEEAVKAMINQQSFDKDALTLIKHLVHEVHEASEDREAAEIREYFDKLQVAGKILTQ